MTKVSNLVAPTNVVVAQSEKVYQAKLKKALEKQAADKAEKAKLKAEKAAKSNSPGIIATIFNAIVTAKKPISKAEILEVLNENFTSEKHTKVTMMKTINAQLGNTHPNRMEREREVIFDVIVDKEGNDRYSFSNEI